MADPAITVKSQSEIRPEASSLTALLAHPLLQDPKFVAAAGGLALLLLFLTLVFRQGKKTRKRNGPATVLLVGPSDGGKTSLFTKLIHDIYPQTHTSIVPSDTTFDLDSPYEDGQKKQIRLIDIPGHPRLRDEVKKYIADTAGVIFVVDIQGIVRNASGVAEQLPPILTALSNISARLPPSAPPPKLLLLAHKADLLARPTPSSSHCPPEIPSSTLTASTDRLKSILTREMDRLKSTRGGTGGKIEGIGKVAGTSGGFFSNLFGGRAGDAGGEDEGDEDESLIWGGKGPFKWEDVEGVEVEWGASGLGATKGKTEAENGNGLDELKVFLWDI
ncbi:signal recognition particle receptor subunit beta [Cryptococcus deuterogattii CA1014]|nr:signal recognition particle receptor subunit beta [Cryptococcus deuterogattii CA1014]KIR96144.1 signal recognition particle receptor subunit beta [Cryptococcus deuterogattii 2001/935-1]